MTRMQKAAWLVIAFVAFMALAAIFGFAFLKPLKVRYGDWVIACFVIGCLAVGALWMLTVLRVALKKPPAGQVEEDERDKMIARRAALGSGMIGFSVFLFVCLGAKQYCKYAGISALPVAWLDYVITVATISFWLTWAIVVLVMYGRKVSYGER